jgi:S-adenosylmethionine hydrolase
LTAIQSLLQWRAQEGRVTIITLTTDFGTTDGYVGTMKGVILGISPGVTLVDVSHQVRPQDVRGGAFVLESACLYFPPGTIHVAVVDPAVGTDRRILVARTLRAAFVGPDNGVLSWALEHEQVESIVRVTQSQYWLNAVSGTFHGRDVFAPVAAHLSRGVPIEEFGVPIADPVRLPRPAPRLEADGAVSAEVMYVDHFGNMVTTILIHPENHRIANLPNGVQKMELGEATRIEILGQRIGPIRRSYADAGPGELVAVVGSSGHLELAVRDGSAAATLKGCIGTPLRVLP